MTLLVKASWPTAGNHAQNYGVIVNQILAGSPKAGRSQLMGSFYASRELTFRLPAETGESDSVVVSQLLMKHVDVTELLRDARFQRFIRRHFSGSREAYLREVIDFEDDSTIKALLLPTSLDVDDANRVLDSVEGLLRKSDKRDLLQSLVIDVEFE